MKIKVASAELTLRRWGKVQEEGLIIVLNEKEERAGFVVHEVIVTVAARPVAASTTCERYVKKYEEVPFMKSIVFD